MGRVALSLQWSRVEIPQGSTDGEWTEVKPPLTLYIARMRTELFVLNVWKKAGAWKWACVSTAALSEVDRVVIGIATAPTKMEAQLRAETFALHADQIPQQTLNLPAANTEESEDIPF